MLYPFTFEPILKKIIWGGSDICPFKGITPVQDGIGESWELSHVEGNYSIVANGELKGRSLDELIRIYGKQLLGEKVIEQFSSTFPLLIKFIDARDNLSIQVHPDDELAKKRHNSFGKTEMWYVINAAPGAALYSGFSKQIDADEYVKRVEDNTIMDVLQRYEVSAGDVFFLPAGRVHAIGAGCFIAEIQQTSNITYRIYDYNRKDANGKGRELHTELAKDAIDYTFYPDYRTHYKAHTNATVELANCKYFTTNLLELDTIMVRDFSELDSFVVYICMGGKATIRDNKGNDISIHQGQTVLIPADTEVITISPAPGAKFMETYIG
ncbi:type I phosphomannose isomerase catalytic subunit [Parabacteroides bouchesdurhonensis]|uniref:type I phosphomannose isomerase catalytic subunit n=1 Tax=Parabacteroides bouchesdurhonensis TaxID=1936995 RepID=UPI000E4A12F7|nr:type I phosphomannose isomerase catalytic subunit [Parabacteroides bouchesdurhonensis]RHJ95209.1 mannose-6-phosphate isomerase [Bacteroides sp. AM07-16]